ncbi:DUF3592 domain-containing protein [Brevifollis gellanilyticus]|nr:DUF3592 domain-containing protein [Brevifollis gellanilyticus]
MKSTSPPPRWMRPFFGTLLLLCGLGCIASLVSKEGRLLASGQRTEGVVEEVIEKHSRTTTDRVYDSKTGTTRYVKRGGGVTYDMMMRFTTAGGKSELTKISAMFYNVPKVGDKHPILYLASNPKVAKVESFRQLWAPMLVGLTVTTLSLGGAFWLLRRRKKPR